MKRFIPIVFSAFLLAGCASMITGQTQEVSIETPGTLGALCVLETEGYRYRVWAPKTIRVQKTGDPLVVFCRAPGNRERTLVIDPKITDTVALNVANVVAPGMLYDYESGAMFKLPEKIVVDFTAMTPQQMAQPDYQQILDQNPKLLSMEEFRPGVAALQRDKYYSPQPLQPRRTDAELFSGGSPPAVAPAPAPVPTGAALGGGEGAHTAESLTKQMNPQVFGGEQEAPIPALIAPVPAPVSSEGAESAPATSSDGFIGGTAVIGGGAETQAAPFDAEAQPVHIYPK